MHRHSNLYEFRAVRALLAERFGGDLRRLFEDLAAEGRKSERPVVSCPAAIARPEPKPSEKSDAASARVREGS